jgi:hypothetical protein
MHKGRAGAECSLAIVFAKRPALGPTSKGQQLTILKGDFAAFEDGGSDDDAQAIATQDKAVTSKVTEDTLGDMMLCVSVLQL